MLFQTQKEREFARRNRGRGRNKAPVFVLGCPRSGTTLLYHMLLSAGGFALYRSESKVFNLLVPRFGGMRSARDRKALMNVWRNSKLFRASGLNAVKITARVMSECHSGGDFLRIVMGEIAQNQAVRRWADCTPEHLLYMSEIKRQLPDALFIHIIRDGRDVALSYCKQGWVCSMPWDRNEQLGAVGLYWKWIVGRGRECGKRLGTDYCEVRFEDLVMEPQRTPLEVGEFIDHDLDYETIKRVGIGSVSEPNSSFGQELERIGPVGRWKTKMSAKEVAEFEALVGDCLEDLRYTLASARRMPSIRTMRLRATYLTLFPLKQWMKARTPLGRMVSFGRIQIDT